MLKVCAEMHIKCPIICIEVNQNLNMSTNFNINLPTSNFMKISSEILRNRSAKRYSKANGSILATFHCNCARNGSYYLCVLEELTMMTSRPVTSKLMVSIKSLEF
jgi:hypothetical protein